MSFEYIPTNNLAGFLDSELGLLKLDLRRNSQVLDSIMTKIADIESPSIEHIVEDLKTREKILCDKITYLLEERAKTKQDFAKVNSRTHSLKKYTIIATAVAIIFIGISFVYLTDLVGQEYRVSNIGKVNDGYVIQNLRGDTIDTWLSWRLVEGATINVNLVDGEKYPDKVEIVRTVLLSEESIEIDNSLLHKGLKGTTSTYYVGWAGALESIQKQTEFHIPQKFNLIESAKGEGDITIRFSTQRSGDGYSGYTKSIADESQNQILKSEITIYDIGNLSKAQFETILRHELGHAFGLAHSTAIEDLMYPTITTNYPYISSCDVDAIVLLYDGGKKSEVTCDI
jgi:hypothetical protein